LRILFVHQNFPGQFPHLAPALRQRGHDVLALTAQGNKRFSPVPTVQYKFEPAEYEFKTHRFATHFIEHTDRGEAVARAAQVLKEKKAWSPDVVIGHPGWGETLFLKEVWPDASHLMFAEFFYSPRGLDVGFDPEFVKPALQRDFWVAARQAPQLLALSKADAILSPTRWQASTYPQAYRDAITIIHDGVDTQYIQTPRPDALKGLGLARNFSEGDEILTFVSRNLEPYRGYHIFMRALPAILDARPNAQIVIIGGDGVSYGGNAPAGKTWKQIFHDEVASRIDSSRVHFTGRVPYDAFVQLMKITCVHAYLSYPFVLSWSMLEAMAAGALIAGSRTPPVEEVIRDGENGLLIDFFDVDAWSNALIDALANPERYRPLREAGRAFVTENYDLHSRCLPAQIKLIEGLH
jgi:glycosyltransferase involved in cell wall biosynthesis